MEKQQLLEILGKSPSIRLIRSKYAPFIIGFLADAFANDAAVSQERLLIFLEGRLDDTPDIDEDPDEETFYTDNADDTPPTLFGDDAHAPASNDIRAKRMLKAWTDSGYLTNYQSERGEVMYELSSHTGKLLDWIETLKEEAYIGTESKFKALFNQLKDLVEFTNPDRQARLEILRNRQLEIQQQIDRIETGEDIDVYEDYQIVPRFNSLNRMAKELVSDFKEVDKNFKDIIEQIYRQQTDNTARRDILSYVFDAYGELHESPQGKSFYAFWEFLLSAALREQWDALMDNLYATLTARNIDASDGFLRDVKQHLLKAGEKVNHTNTKMAEKVSRLIRQNELRDTETMRRIINDIRKLLMDTAGLGGRPDIGFEIDENPKLQLSFDRPLTLQPQEQATYTERPVDAKVDIADLAGLERIFNPHYVDRDALRANINRILAAEGQTTLDRVIEQSGGITRGLTEVIAYLGITNEYHTIVSDTHSVDIPFNKEERKSITLPKIIITK